MTDTLTSTPSPSTSGNPKTKTVDAHFKASADGGEFTAIVSVFGNVDSVRDVVVLGAFEDSLKSWADSGDPIPCYWSHDWRDPESNIGTIVEAKELAPSDPLLPDALKDFGGLWVRAVLDNEGRAAKVRKLLKGRRVRKFSFAYDILEAAWAERDGASVYELRKLALIEAGPCLVGANDATDLLTAKSAPPVVESPTELPALPKATIDQPPHVGHPSGLSLANADLALLDL